MNQADDLDQQHDRDRDQDQQQHIEEGNRYTAKARKLLVEHHGEELAVIGRDDRATAATSSATMNQRLSGGTSRMLPNR